MGNQNARSSLAVQNQATGYGFGDYMLGYIQQIQDAAGLAIASIAPSLKPITSTITGR